MRLSQPLTINEFVLRHLTMSQAQGLNRGGCVVCLGPLAEITTDVGILTSSLFQGNRDMLGQSIAHIVVKLADIAMCLQISLESAATSDVELGQTTLLVPLGRLAAAITEGCQTYCPNPGVLHSAHTHIAQLLKFLSVLSRCHGWDMWEDLVFPMWQQRVEGPDNVS